MKRILSLILIALIAVAGSSAIEAKKKHSGNRTQWMQEMRKAKLEFMIKELSITDAQRDQFSQTYEAMQKELDQLRRESFELNKSIERKKDVTDIELDRAATASFEFKSREGAIERSYLDKFRKILSPKQLFLFHRAEMKWMKRLMKHRK